MLKAGIMGMGGFAASHQSNMLKLESEEECRLICSCDPNISAFQSAMDDWSYKSRGIKVFTDYTEMLDQCGTELDMVIIPTPINLHLTMHKAAVEAGIPVYLEKPPTLDYTELQQMLETEQKASKSTNVGFNYTIEETRLDLKRRIISGEFGSLQRIELFGNWPRTDAYFKRNNWAGRLTLDGRLILDSIMGNAMGHYVHNVLLWSGLNDVLAWSDLESVNAELYRVNEIQGADTVFVEAVTESHVLVRIALTHACNGDAVQYERLVFDKAEIDYRVQDKYIISYADGRIESADTDRRDLLFENVKHFARYVSGKQSRPMNMLSDSIPFVHLNDLAYVSSGNIATIPSSYITRHSPDSSSFTSGVLNIVEVCRVFVESGVFPSGQGLPWAAKGNLAEKSDIVRLRDVISKMVS